MIIIFKEKGWRSFFDKFINSSIEKFIDAITEISHLVFERRIPKLESLQKKSVYLSKALINFLKLIEKSYFLSMMHLKFKRSP